MSLGASNREVVGLEFAGVKRDYLSPNLSSIRLFSLDVSNSGALFTGGLIKESILGFDVVAVLTSPDGITGVSTALKVGMKESFLVKGRKFGGIN